ncbi:hypothetical protein DUI87_16856 [Hirundo rustica rustica]|uniref:Retroviral nucleocapsid Gag protein p24 C-terminal domain-containing protein n=1 Tax=Hirundo rustica rustica TaxID=333673 RepID=A0A3M0K4J3_HIRRU|nr:hypothetical protein DUI87_16856 [Hirundo rustica rustica]
MGEGEVSLASANHRDSPSKQATQPDKSFQPYSKIKQLPSEPLVTFVERLTRAIELQVKNEGAQEQVLEEMALANADEQCKAAILSLSIELAPTLYDMLQQKSPDVIVKDPATRETKSPHDQVTWGRGYAFVSTPPDLNQGKCLLFWFHSEQNKLDKIVGVENKSLELLMRDRYDDTYLEFSKAFDIVCDTFLPAIQVGILQTPYTSVSDLGEKADDMISFMDDNKLELGGFGIKDRKDNRPLAEKKNESLGHVMSSQRRN